MNNRWRNYGLWLAIVALIPMVIQALADYNIMVTLPNNFQTLVKAIFTVLILAGIISDPTTDNKGFKDDKVDSTDNSTNDIN